MTLYSFFKEFHSGFRYIVIVLVLLALVRAFMGWLGKRPYGEGNRKLNLFAMISVHTQFLLGIILFFISPMVQFSKDTMKNPITRYFTVEHWVIMLIAIVLITIGHSKSKKAALPEGKHKAIAIFYLIGIVLISVGIMLIPQ
ncbi:MULTISPECIES: cytochrome B [Mucilaginibacter]|jgi:cytochrome b561|uniref:cytochrome B n=1 Tax=Mucilaginibacter TaxID=423349 RepID=UPI00159E6CA2|nr:MULTISPECIES: cytochrome B [unclassified Mucilaginibacter]NVM67461.1 cytochrome b561 [Mucilaginibacter sp. SG538B]WEA03962.1 cytochrome B [Mucilaginibacter sp. SJ]